MSIINPKYRRLYAQKEYLTDEVVLIQAWKKAQRYIRKSNWYADQLELDQSAVLLEEYVKKWALAVDYGTFRPRHMRMVPAPKTHRWGFEGKKWCPAENKEGGGEKKPIHLRPLAHLGICEQTLATAAMLCLADCIETAQGDTSVTDYFEARRRRIHSYGNRLYCHFDSDTVGDTQHPRPLARFTWGNSGVYSRYSEDYRRFLERPRVIAANVQDLIGDDEELFIIKLDISAFYDRIHRPTLIGRLKTEYADFVKHYTLTGGVADDDFWASLEQIFDWRWDPADEALQPFLKGRVIPDGLPQGLVASGFFANAYLLDFDRCISGMLKKQLDEEGLRNVTIHDYCRYVDDIRLVVSAKGNERTQEKLGGDIADWMNGLLNATANPGPAISDQYKLKLNTDKTEVTPFRLMDGQIGVTSRMALIQSEISGTGDMETLQETTAGLDALLSLADSFDCCESRDSEPQHPLAIIATPKSDVRDDTLKRYAAYRLRQVLRLRRTMTDLDAEISPGVKARHAIDHELEMFARKLIRAWTHDPSLSLVLRYGMDLFPTPDLLQPVLDGLHGLIELVDGKETEKHARVAWYICADLLRAGAMETGWNVRELEMPDTADLEGYRARLLDFARRVLDPAKLGGKAPWYVQQQALLLMAVLDPCPALAPATRTPEIQHYIDLLHTASYPPCSPLQPGDVVLALVFQQLHQDRQRFAQWLVGSLEGMNQDDRLERLKVVSFNHSDLMCQVVREIDSRNLDWITDEHGYLTVPRGMRHDTRDLTDFDGEDVVLWNVVTHRDNPFRQEIHWLKLAHALIQQVKTLVDGESFLKKFSLHNITLNVKSWKRLKQPDLKAGRLTIKFNREGRGDPRLVTPAWCVPEKKWFYALGRLLRSAITAEQDFTLTPYLGHHDWDGYTGMRNSWYTRRLGMIHAPESLSGEAAPFSPWVSELLMRLVQWPGVEMSPGLIRGWEGVEILDDLAVLIKKRLTVLGGMFGKASGLPVYPIPVERDRFSGKDGTLRVVLVQTLIPRQGDFTQADPCLDNLAYRARHRRHLSAMCRMIRTQLEAQRSVEGGKTEGVGKASADLIVLPELAVHPDDLWILKRLSDVTKAMLYFGLTPVENCEGKLTNSACWLIPSQKKSGRSWIVRHQGKQHPTTDEKQIGITGWRPYQVVVELPCPPGFDRGFRMTGTICYDATDLNLAADMRNVSDMFVISALNKDVSTFDNMVAALHYHMFQHVVLVNTGEFGGSTVQAPFKERHEKLISPRIFH